MAKNKGEYNRRVSSINAFFPVPGRGLEGGGLQSLPGRPDVSAAYLQHLRHASALFGKMQD